MGSSRKHKEKDRERGREKDHTRRSRSKSREREKDKHSSSSSHHRHSHHRHRDKDVGSLRKRTHESDEEMTNNDKKKVKVETESKIKLEESAHFTDEERVRHDNDNDDNDNNDNAQLSLSIDETNKLRAKLGLKPLQVDDDTESSNKDKDESKDEIPKPKEVFIKTENISEKQITEKLRERISIRREQRKIQKKLKKVKKLADDDDNDDDDVASWVEKNRKILEEKEKAARRAQMLEEMDEEFGVTSIVNEDIKATKAKAYTTKHLKGLTIGHREESFAEGQQIILTLRDKAVLDENDDVLENVNIIDDEKAKKNIENKIKKPDYKPYDEPEFDEFGILKKKTVLSKYDEEIDGIKKDSFKIGTDAANREKELEMIRMKLRQDQGKISLDSPQLRLANEYYTHEEMQKFKKPKKVRKVLRKKDTREINDSEDIPSSSLINEQDHGSRNKRSESSTTEVSQNTSQVNVQKINLNISDKMEFDHEMVVPEEDLSNIPIEEDDAEIELQLALNKARRLKERENASESIVKIAEEVRQRQQYEEHDDDDSAGAWSKSISGNIILNSTAEFCRNLGDIPTYGLSGNRDEDEDLMDIERELSQEKNKNNPDAESNRGAWNEVELKDAEDLNFDDTEGQPILEAEPDVSVGLAGALKLAMKKGYLDKDMKKQMSAQRNSMLQAQSYLIEEKFYEDDKVGRRERYNGPVSEFRDKDSYRPDIKLEYVDDNGRLLDQKEAFRHLSHKFHGKGPGKNKVDKRMKKKDQESKLRQMSSTDTPLNTLKLLTDKQKETQSPFIVLTGAQKTVIPATISKSKK